jgi:fibronectin-binding autotransporter adhesin
MSIVSHTVRGRARRSSARRLARDGTRIAAAVAVALAGTTARGVELDVSNGAADLTTAGSYVQNTAPAATSDITFTAGTAYSPATFTVNSSLTAGSVNALSTTPLTITNTGGSAATLTLGTAANAVAPATADLLYVGPGGSLTVAGGSGPLSLALSASGNFDVAGTATIGAALASTGAFGFTKTNVGTLTLAGANTYTGATGLTGGNLVLDFTGDNTNKLSTAALTLGGGALTLNGNAGAATGQTVGGTTLTGGSRIVVNAGAGQTATLTLGGITRTALGGNVDFSLNNGSGGTAAVNTTTANANVSGGQQTILGGYATFGGGTTWAVSGSGATAGTISGLPTASYATAFTAGADVDVAPATAAPAAVTINSLRFNDGTAATTVTPTGIVTVATGGILVTPTVGNNAVTIAGTGLTSGNGVDLIVNQYNPANTLTISTVISGTIGITKAGPGTLVLGNVANTFTGGINISGGVLSAAVTQLSNVTAVSPLGSATGHAITLNNNATFQLTGNGNFNPQSGTSTVTIGSGGGTLDANGTSIITLDDGGQFASTGPLTKVGTGQLVLGNATTAFVNTGTINVTAGSLRVINNGVNALGAAPFVSVASGATIDVSGVTVTRPLILAGTGLTTNARGALTNSTTTASTVSGTVNLSAATTVGGTGNINVSGLVSGTGPLTKIDAANLTLSRAAGNTYTGDTTVTGGTLTVTNATGSATSAGNVLLNPTGGTTLASGAAGTIAGNVTAATSNTTANIAPGGLYGGGANATFGSLTVGGLALTSNATRLAFDLSTPAGTNDLLTVTGLNALTVAGANKVPVLLGQAPAAGGTYRLVAFNQDGSGTVSANAFASPTAANARQTYALQVTPGTGTQQFLELVVAGNSAPIAANFVGATTPTSWTTAANWSTNPLVPGLAGDAVTFNNGTAIPTTIQVNLDGQQRVGSLTFNNTGTTAFNVAAGTSTGLSPGLFLDNTPNAASATLANPANNNTISAPVTVISPTNVTVTGTTGGTPNTLTISGAMFGSAGLTLTAANTGALVLGGGNGSYTGAIAVNGGVLRAANAVGFGAGTATAAAGGTIDLNGTALTTTPIILNGTGFDGLGALVNTSGTAASTSGTVTLASATTIGGVNNFTISGVVGGSGVLTKAGAGNLTLSAGANTLTGAVVVNAGTLTLTGSNSGAGTIQSPTITVNPGGTLVTTAGDALGFTANRNALTINGGSVLNNGSGARVTLSNTVNMTGGLLGGSSVGGSATNAGAFSFSGTLGVTATSDAAGNPAVVSAPIASNSGSITLAVARGPAAAASDLTVSGTITNYNGTAGPTGVTKTGLGVLTLTAANTYTNPTLLNGGTTVTNNPAALGGTAITVGTGAAVTATTGNATLVVRGTTTIGTATAGSITVAGGNGTTTGQGTLSLFDGSVNTLNLLARTAAATDLTVGSATAAGVLNFDLGTAAGVSDRINLNNNAVSVGAGGAVINVNPLGGLVNGTYTLLSYGSQAAGAAGTGGFAFANGTQVLTLGGATLTLSNTGTAETLTVATNAGATPATAYFQGSVDAAWNTIDPTTAVTNFTSDAAGTTNTLQLPGTTTDVHFYAANATAANLNTTLGQNFTIQTLTVDGGSLTQNVGIASGGATAGTNTLTITPAAATAGISLAAGAGNLTISAPVALGAAQTWTNSSAAGVLAVSGPGVTTNGFALTVAGTGNTTISAPIVGAGVLTKSGTGTLTLSGNNALATGGTVILGGTVASGVDNALGTAALTLGDATGATGTLNLGAFNQTVSSLTVNTSTASGTATNTITVGAGKTLTVNGGVTVGLVSPATSNQAARLTIGGGGSLAVTAVGGTFAVGASTSTTASAQSVVDLTGLAAANINLGATGTLRVNQPTGTNLAGNTSRLLLPIPTAGVTATTPVTTVTAGAFNVGDNQGNGSGANQINSAVLGTGLTTLNVGAVNIGTGGRDFGSLTFAAGNGTLRLRGADGAGRAAFNVGTGGATTGVGPGTGVTGNVVDLSGHAVDLFLGTLAIGSQNRNTNRTDNVTLNAGTVDVTAVQVAAISGTANTGASNNTFTSNLTLAGGATTVGAGGIDVANGSVAVTGTDILAGTVTVSGGTVSVANNPTLGAAVRLATNTQATGLTTNGTLSVTGGTLTLGGNVVKGTATGPGTATLSLNGGTLALGGNAVGTAALPVTATFLAGTLDGLGQLNGGGALTKTGTGTLSITGTNAYTGATAVNAGTLLNNGTLSATAGVTVAAGATYGGSGTLAGPLTVNGTLAPGNSPGVVTLSGPLTLASGSTYAVEIGGTTPGSGSGNYDQTNTTASTGTPLTVGGSVLSVANFNGFTSANPSQLFFILTQGGSAPVAGQFVDPVTSAALADGSTVTFPGGAGSGQITYFADSGTNSLTGGNDVALFNVTLVPEPAALGTLGLAAAGLLARRRRARRA